MVRGQKGFALIVVLGLLTSLTILFALVNLRNHGKILFLAGHRDVVMAAEERAMVLRLAAERFGAVPGEMELVLSDRAIRLEVARGEGRRSFVVKADGAEIGGYWVQTSGRFLIQP